MEYIIYSADERHCKNTSVEKTIKFIKAILSLAIFRSLYNVTNPRRVINKILGRYVLSNFSKIGSPELVFFS